MKARFDGFKYRDCKWCGGSGCLACEGEADKAYRRAFPDGPKPIATFDLSDTADVEAARVSIGIEAVRKAFGKGGGGVSEIIANIAKAKNPLNAEGGDK